LARLPVGLWPTAHYGQFIWACDFFTVTTATLRTYYVLFVIDIGSRKIRLCNVTEHPDEAWVIQQFRNLAVMHDDLPRHWNPMGSYKELGRAPTDPRP